MIRRPPSSKRPDAILPYTTLVRAQGADDRRAERRRQADQQRHLATVEQAHQEVAAEFVGAERMLRRRRLLGVEEVDQVAVDTEPGFHQGGSGGAEREDRKSTRLNSSH